jgi:molecular chaperone DnaK (HSP70)
LFISCADAELSSSGRDEAHAKAKSTVLVVDFGGGGVEASLVSRTDGMLAIAGTCRNASLGGSEFTKRLVDFCAKDHKKKTVSVTVFSVTVFLITAESCCYCSAVSSSSVAVWLSLQCSGQ